MAADDGFMQRNLRHLMLDESVALFIDDNTGDDFSTGPEMKLLRASKLG